jgi:hypothetical protein
VGGRRGGDLLGPTLAVVLAVAGAGCAVTHAVRPLGRGNAAVHGSLGGPLVEISGADVAMPIASVGGGYGLRDDVTATLEADLTAAAFGVAHLAPGVAYHALVRDAGAVPTVTVAAGIHLLTNITDTRVAPQASVAMAWRVRRRHLLYVGADAALAFGDPTRLVVGPLLGGELRVGQAWGVALEGKWLAPNYDVAPLAPNWLSPGSHGYLFVLLGATRYFGEVR